MLEITIGLLIIALGACLGYVETLLDKYYFRCVREDA